MIAFLVDQNFNEDIVDGLTRRDATLEFTHVRDVSLAAAPDMTILEWAATRLCQFGSGFPQRSAGPHDGVGFMVNGTGRRHHLISSPVK